MDKRDLNLQLCSDDPIFVGGVPIYPIPISEIAKIGYMRFNAEVRLLCLNESDTGTYKPLQVFDATQLKADGQRYFTSVKDIVSRAQAEFSKLGKTDITNVFKDSKGNIQSFTASVTKADGVVEKFNFNLAKIKDGAQSIKGFVQSNSILTDKNAGSNLEQTLNYLNRINTKIADITSKTCTICLL